MRQVEFARYYLPGLAGKKPHASRFVMTAEEAAQRGALGQVPGTCEIREVPETDEERQRVQAHYQSAGRDSVKPAQGLMMEATPTRSTNVHANLRAGRYWYVDHPGSAPQLVDVTYELGLPVARFQDMEPEDAGLELDPRDFSGEFRRIR